jgi:hypothetical protein
VNRHVNLALAAGFVLILFLPARGWGAGELCCKDYSSIECNSGDIHDGEKGTCPTGNKCFSFAPCPGKKGEVACACTSSASPPPQASALTVKPKSVSLGLDLKFSPTVVEHVTLSNVGTEALQVGITQTAGRNAILVKEHTLKIGPGDQKKVAVTFAPPEAGSFTGAFEVQSDATVGPQTFPVTVEATATNQFRTTLGRPTLVARHADDIEMAYDPESKELAAVFFEDLSPTHAGIYWVGSRNNGATWCNPRPLFKGENWIAPRIARDPAGSGFVTAATKESGGFSTYVVKWIPGSIIPKATFAVPGIVHSLATGGGYIYLATQTSSTLSNGVGFFGSTDARSWMAYTNVPFNSDEVNLDPGVVYDDSTERFVVTWTGLNISSSPNFTWTRYGSVSLDRGRTFSDPTVFHSANSGNSLDYFNPATIFSGAPTRYSAATLVDAGTLINATSNADNTFMDTLPPDSNTPVDTPIGGSGLQAGFGIAFNNTWLNAIAMDTSHDGALNFFSGPVGGPLEGGPIAGVNHVLEARMFRSAAGRFVITIVQNKKDTVPGRFSVIRGQFE